MLTFRLTSISTSQCCLVGKHVPSTPTPSKLPGTPRAVTMELTYTGFYFLPYLRINVQPTSLALKFDLWDFAGEIVLELQTCSHSSSAGLSHLTQHIRQGHQELRLCVCVCVWGGGGGGGGLIIYIVLNIFVIQLWYEHEMHG